jgi:hypothetical protein
MFFNGKLKVKYSCYTFGAAAKLFQNPLYKYEARSIKLKTNLKKTL